MAKKILSGSEPIGFARDLAGQKFGRLTVGCRAPNRGRRTCWQCQCECGNIAVVPGDDLKRKDKPILSCGCLRKEKIAAQAKRRAIHGLSHLLPEYPIWNAMIQRCYNPRQESYGRYGGRGITVHHRYRNRRTGFTNFLKDIGSKPGPSYSIERINNNRGYEPGNIRWATRLEQGANRRNNHLVTINGETKHLSAWLRERGLRACTFRRRVQRGMTEEEALLTPSGKHHA